MLCTPSPACLALLRHFEGLRLEAYPDPASGDEPWTIGYGHTGGVLRGAQCATEDAERWLAQDAQIACTEVDRMLLVSVTQCERDALTSFVFNLGAKRLYDSTLLRKLTKGDRAGAADQFLRWNRGGGRVLPGLVARREAERRMFLGLDWRGES